MTATEIKRLWQTRPEDVAKAMRASLRDFGYDNLSVDDVRTRLTNSFGGHPEPDVISLFVDGWVKDGTE